MTRPSSPKPHYDVAVIGAGVAGLGPAWRLAQKGYEVAVFDRGQAGGGASRAAAGMLAPACEVQFGEDALLRLQQESLERFPGFVAELSEITGLDLDYRDHGALVVALEPDDTEALERVLSYQQSMGLAARRVTAAEAREMEPHLSPNTHSAVLCPADHQVDAWKLVDALVAALGKAGGQLFEKMPVAAIERADGRAHGVRLEDDRLIEADAIVVAAGAWSGQIAGVPAFERPVIRPVRGQALCVVGENEPLCTRVIRAPDAYLAPKADGSVVVGATMEERGFDERLTAGGIFEILRGAWRAMPTIYDLELRDMWAGFRPVSLDDGPLMGASSLDGLWLSTGHGRHGILLSAVTADVVSQAVDTGRTPRAYQRFAPTRF